MSEPREVALIADGARLLAEARDLFEVQQVLGLAKAAVAYARAKDLGEDAVRSANRIVILATLRLGQELIAGQERGEVADKGRPVNVEATDIIPATLAELGVSRDLSSKAQRYARSIDRILEYARHADMPSQAGALRIIAEDAGAEFDEVIARVVSPEAQRDANVYKFQAALMGASMALDAIDPPLSLSEAEPFLITCQAMGRRLGRGRKGLEAIS